MENPPTRDSKDVGDKIFYRGALRARGGGVLGELGVICTKGTIRISGNLLQLADLPVELHGVDGAHHERSAKDDDGDKGTGPGARRRARRRDRAAGDLKLRHPCRIGLARSAPHGHLIAQRGISGVFKTGVRTSVVILEAIPAGFNR